MFRSLRRPYGAGMTTTTTTSSSTAASDVATVAALFETFAHGDLAGFAERLEPDATWDHRNDDRLGGIHRGREGIGAFLSEAVQLTSGTLRAAPQAIMSDGEGRVAVLVQLNAERPDGRVLDDRQILLCVVDGDRVRTIDQFIGDPSAVTAFWA
jgi:ketosteroid isomerase-like protein